MGFHYFGCRAAVAASLLICGTAFADANDVKDCKSADRYHNSVAAFYTCDKALKQKDLSNEDRAELLLGRGEAAYFVGRFDLSSTDLDEALTLNPNLNEAYLRRAWTRIMTNQYPAALQDISNLLSQEPDNVDALFAIGYIYQETPEWESKTMPAYKRILELNPNHYLTRLNLASIYSNYDHQHDKAIAEYDKILSGSKEDLNKIKMWRNPSFPTLDFRGQVRSDRAEAIYRTQDLPKALSEFDSLVLDYPNIASVFVGRARVYERLNRFSEELADARAAIKLDSYWPAQRLSELDALYHLKRYDEALPAATKIIDDTSFDAVRGEALFWRGYINKALHHHEESLRDFEQSFVLNPQWLNAVLTQVIQSGYYDGESSDSYSEKARNGLQACILDAGCGT